MRSLLLITRREVNERLATQSFRLFSAGLFLLVAGLIVAIDQAPKLFGEEDAFELGVAADAPAGLTEAIQGFAAAGDVEVNLIRFSSETEAATLLESGDLDAYLADGRLVYENNESTTLSNVVTQAVFSQSLEQRLDALGLSEQEAAELLSPPDLEIVEQNPAAADEEERQFIGFLAALALFVTISIYGGWILTGVVEEKASRVVEVLLGTVRPYELLTGKTLGILLVAVSQLLMALGGAVAGLIIVGTDSLPEIALDVVLASIPLYVLGLLLYSLIYAAVGATVTRQTDAQSAATPIVAMLLVPYMSAAVWVPDNPDTPIATALSIFPLTSPLVMPARVAAGDPSAIELAVCYVLLVPAIVLVAFLGGRIYAGVILSTRRPGLSSLVSILLGAGRKAQS